MMKLNGFAVLAVAVLSVGCGLLPTPTPTPDPILIYLNEVAPLHMKYIDDTQFVRDALDRLEAEGQKPCPSDPSKTQWQCIKPASAGGGANINPMGLYHGGAAGFIERVTEAIQASRRPTIPASLSSALDEATIALAFAIERATILAHALEGISPSGAAYEYHWLLWQAIVKERAAWAALLSYYNGVRLNGIPDEETYLNPQLAISEVQAALSRWNEAVDSYLEGYP